MFTPDVISLRQFYASAMGASAASAIRRAVERMWPPMSGETVLGVGYCLPFLDCFTQPDNHFTQPDNQLLIAMPAFQGAIYWPSGLPNRVFLSEESQLPLPSGQFNRILLVHAAEGSEQLHTMLQEVWRIATPGARILMIVPNRSSLWARSSRSPFGYGRPFSLSQMKHLLGEVELTFTRAETALHMPPLRNRWALRAMPYLETLLKPLGMFIGGVLLVEAEKQVYGAIREPVAVPARRYRTPGAIAQPAPVLTRLKK